MTRGTSNSRHNHDATFLAKSFEIVQHFVYAHGIQADAAGNDVGEVEFALAAPFEEEREFLGEVIGHADDLGFSVDELMIKKKLENLSVIPTMAARPLIAREFTAVRHSERKAD